MDTFTKAHDIEKYPPGLNPIDLFLDADIQTRSEVLLNHPDVTGFVYIHDDEITKAFFPTKVIDFKAKDSKKKKNDRSNYRISKRVLTFFGSRERPPERQPSYLRLEEVLRYSSKIKHWLVVKR